MKAKKVTESILAYILWIVTLALGVWFVIISREAFETFLGKYFIKEQGQFILSRQARFWDIVFSLVLWLLWFAMMIVTEEYYRKGIEKHTTWRRFAKVTGVLLVLIFIADLCSILMFGFASAGWLRWLLSILEILVGVTLIVASRHKPAPQTEKMPPGQVS